MAIVICSECGSPVEIGEGEEWGYCPMCENDQVELKKVSKEEVNPFKVKIHLLESEIGEKDLRIEELEQKLKITEKALELACGHISYVSKDTFIRMAKEMIKSE